MYPGLGRGEEEEEIEEEGEWGEREFVSDISGDEDGLSDLEEVGVRFVIVGYVRGCVLIESRMVVVRATKTRMTMRKGVMRMTRHRAGHRSLRSASASPHSLSEKQNVC